MHELSSAIQVTTEVNYLAAESDPEGSQYVFSYTITIANTSASQAAQLLNRHWIITDGNGEVQEVRGAGVVGQQPRIPCERGFRYTSGCVLTTPVGTMEGSYEFIDDEGQAFVVSIPRFTLRQPNAVH